MHARHLLSLYIALAAATSACGMSGGPIFTSDGGTDAGPDDAGPIDGGPEPDVIAPQVLDTTPRQGAIDVAVDATVQVVFSEPIAAGTVHVEIGGVTTAVAGTVDGATFSFSPTLPSRAQVRIIVERDFSDLAGNALAAPYVFQFTTGDAVAPVVTSTDPSEGASVSARRTNIRISFSEPMDPTVGDLSLQGGPGTLGAPAWTLGGLIVPVSGLAYGTSYRVVLSNFADPAGNPLDPTAYLGNGALDFTTSADTDVPHVLDASPSEGQIDVPDTTDAITVVFDEAMDTSITTAELSAGSTSTTVSGTWSGSQIEFDVAGRLARNAAHRLDLSAMRDAAGNPLDPRRTLGDGALDFVTGIDIFAPYVGFTDPVESSSTLSFRQNAIVVVFSETMDTTVTSVEISDGTSNFTANGTWSLAGTRFTIDVAGKLYASRSYTIDFRSFRDFGGTLLDAAHPYLGDGVLEFTLTEPTGENCQDALTLAQASSTSGGVNEWMLAPGVATTNDGSNTCRSGTNSSSVDAVIRYTKTTPSASDGGMALRVYVESAEASSSAWMAVAVLRDECQPSVAGTGSARVHCVSNRNPSVSYLDVGPGDYYVWVSRHTGSDFRGATVRIEEIPVPPEGETCVDPFTTSTASPIYTAPTTPSDPHVWTIAQDTMVSMDHAVAYNGPGAMPCDHTLTSSTTPDTDAGPDAVIALPKRTASSLGWLRVQSVDTSYELVAELRDQCAPGTATSLACQENLRVISGVPRIMETVFAGGAGEYYLWLAADNNYAPFPGAIVSYRDVEPGPGDTCATAIPIPVDATTSVTPDRPNRLPAPSCFATTENVTWYRFTTTQRFTHVRSTGGANIAGIRAADGSELGCQANAATAPLITFVPPGTEVCVAVASGTAVSALTVESLPYAGNLGVATPLAIARPINPSTGSPRTITAETWMTVTPTTLYMGVGTQGVLVAPKIGFVTAEFMTDVTTALGQGGASIDEAVFSLDDTSATGVVRMYRLVTSSGMWSPTAWDSGSAYLATAMNALTQDGSALLYASRWSSTVPTRFHSLSPSAAGPATLLGSTNLVRNVAGIASDATYFYLVAQTDGTTATEGIYRIPRSDSSATPTLLFAVDINSTRASIALDDLAAPQYLYFRAANGSIHVIADPAGAAPRYLGPISILGRSGDDAMAFDRTTRSLYFFETVTDTNGNFVRLD